MALDGIVTRAIVSELQAIVGQRISKIYQPGDHDLVFTLRGAGGGGKLILSANPTYPRVHFTDRSTPNPPEAPMFCMLMRKHCEGGVIEAVTQVGMERIIYIDIRQRDELGDLSSKKIIIELMGRHSNIILTDSMAGTIIDGIHHVTPAISSYRIVMPGFAYTQPPEQHKRSPLEITASEFIEICLDAENNTAEPASPDDTESPQPEPKRPSKDPVGWIVETFSGVSPLIAQEIVHRAHAERNSEAADVESVVSPAESGFGRTRAQELAAAFESIMEPVRSGRFAPVIGTNAKGKLIFSAIPLTMLEGTVKHYESISTCMEDYFGDKGERDTVKQKVSDLIRFLTNERSKNVKKLDNLNSDLDEAADAEEYRIKGELLFASLHTLSKGDKEARLTNYYDEEQSVVAISLDPLLSPSDNAQRYFKKYNKYKNSLTVIEEQLEKTREEISYVESLLQQLDHASLNDIEEIREELVAGGYLRERGKKGKKKKKPTRPTLQVFTSSEGVEIYVGKNNLQNEYLTNRLSGPNDTWLHTKDIPGSHVVIRSEKFSEATLNEAAQLAAYFSQAKHSSGVPVDTTLIRHVRKPSGSKPGFVIYDHQRTLFITPDESVVKGLSSTLKN
ncbi:NFACT family protein [Paenibacillus sp. HN-1]|uniref:Rqc2 family fibronectin-binding protein n=1 Tax=Paenibacillus TaxID=44249 RepID=UPI001CA807D5|nr:MULTISPECIES: NFACT RNA binding domain-containing protein [Paenibacillus]MBY9082298.1 NFACT family protein [Paenibacillus sp. CGMCC 1.18879]MBY9086338.1 NFACT family protein [Paenibacillus sinensis]